MLAMKVEELGEFGLIERLSQVIATWEKSPSPARQGVVIGIGDDAAAWHSPALELATTDTLVQGVHFLPGTFSWKELGWKALAINISDIAAMGGIPNYALVSLALPGDLEVEDVVQLYQGMAEVANQFHTVIVGGNISYAPLLVITIALTGSAEEGHLLLRSAAVPGDLVAVTGYLGSSAAGQQMLTQHLHFDPETETLLRKAHLQPQPRIAEGQLLVRCGIRAAIDISDGLMGDLSHICEMSQVGARVRVYQVPVHPVVKKVFPQDYLRLALSGGEDYELLFTGSREVISRVRREAGCPVTIVGEIIEDNVGQVILFDEKGVPFAWDKKGWDHFESRSR